MEFLIGWKVQSAQMVKSRYGDGLCDQLLNLMPKRASKILKALLMYTVILKYCPFHPMMIGYGVLYILRSLMITHRFSAMR